MIIAINATPWQRAAGAVVLACAIVLWFAPEARSMEGDELVGIGAVQKGTAGAGVASPKDATWTFLNPASIVELGPRLDVGVDILLSRRTAEIEGPSFLFNYQLPEERLLMSLMNPDAESLADSSPVAAPSFGIVWPFEHLSLGWGIFAVQGNNVAYPRSRTLPGLEEDNLDRRAQLEVFKMPLSIAHRFENGWSVGLALVGVYSRLRTDSLTLNLAPTAGGFEWDESYGWGFKLSVFKRWEKWAFGATYTSRQWMSRFDEYSDLVNYRLDHPQQFQVGLAYRPVPRLELLLDYKFIDWSDIRTTGNDAIHGGLGWNDQNILKFGATYDLSRRLTLRAGVSYGKCPVPGDSVFTNVLFPAITEMHATFGLSCAIGKRHEVHLAYMHAFRHEMTDTGTGDIFSAGGRGTTISLEQDSITLQYSYKFRQGRRSRQ